MEYIRQASQRGKADFGWLNSHHSFSFGHYYDPAHMGFSVLRVINDDIVKPGYGFETHGHRDMEIISYVISGELEHKDSQGNQSVIPAGDIQRMSAGSGILHSEFNPSDQNPVNFLQIWIQPSVEGIPPSYAQKQIMQNEAVTPIVSPSGSDTAISVNQDMVLYRVVLEDGESARLPVGQRAGYLHVIKGQAQVGSHIFAPGDGYGITEQDAIEVIANGTTEALWFDLPPTA